MTFTPSQAGTMTQTDGSPDKEENKEIHELSQSGPMWERIAQLVGDEELARKALDQLKEERC